MNEPIDDENEAKRKKRTEGESDSSASGFVRASSDGVQRVSEQDSNEIEANRKKKSGGGETDTGSGSTATGLVRAGADGVIRLSVDQQKGIWADFRHLDLNEVVAAVAEFFSEFPARASANCTVAWQNITGIPIVNMVIKFGQDVAMAVRERTRESAVQVRRRYGINIKFAKRGGMAVSIPNPGAGLS